MLSTILKKRNHRKICIAGIFFCAQFNKTANVRCKKFFHHDRNFRADFWHKKMANITAWRKQKDSNEYFDRKILYEYQIYSKLCPGIYNFLSEPNFVWGGVNTRRKAVSKNEGGVYKQLQSFHIIVNNVKIFVQYRLDIWWFKSYQTTRNELNEIGTSR